MLRWRASGREQRAGQVMPVKLTDPLAGERQGPAQQNGGHGGGAPGERGTDRRPAAVPPLDEWKTAIEISQTRHARDNFRLLPRTSGTERR